MLGAFTGENKGVVARSLEVVAEGAAAVCGGDGAGLCGNCGNVKAAGAGCAGAGERSGRDNDNILLGQCLLLAGQVVVENFGGHRLAAEIQFLFFVAPRIVLELTGRKVEFRNFIHVSGILAHYINPFKFALWAYPLLRLTETALCGPPQRIKLLIPKLSPLYHKKSAFSIYKLVETANILS